MAWTTLPTYVNGALTAAQLNAIADNIEESAAAKATSAGQYFVATSANSLAARIVVQDLVSTTDTDTQTSYGDIATLGPTVVMVVQTQALVLITNASSNTSGGAGTYTSVEVTGATSVAPLDERALIFQGGANAERQTSTNLFTSLTAGSNTFRSKYRVDSNTGEWKWRRMVVMGF